MLSSDLLCLAKQLCFDIPKYNITSQQLYTGSKVSLCLKVRFTLQGSFSFYKDQNG